MMKKKTFEVEADWDNFSLGFKSEIPVAFKFNRIPDPATNSEFKVERIFILN